jgi:uncharacterized cupredoxin-like copper-binding protein
MSSVTMGFHAQEWPKMTFSRHLMLSGLSGALSVLVCSGAAFAETIVKVSLWDKGPASMEMTDAMAPMGMAMAGAKMDMATMGITTSVQEIPAGEITFEIINDSGEFYHSMAFSPIVDQTVELPYLTDKMMIDEEALAPVSKGKELKPHATGTVKAELTPGTYVLYCNITGHYMMGMWTVVTVVE